MTRDEAAQLLWRVAYDKYGLDDNPMRQREAADIVVAALIRGNSDQDELSAYRATGLTPEAVQEMVSFPYTADEEDETKMMANQCVACGAEMPEGDQVCKACRAEAETRTVAWAAENISGRIAQLEAEVGILKRLLETMQHE